jgi:hypothetical protein
MTNLGAGGWRSLTCHARFGCPTLSGLVYERVGCSSLGFSPKFSWTNLNSVVYYPCANWPPPPPNHSVSHPISHFPAKLCKPATPLFATLTRPLGSVAIKRLTTLFKNANSFVCHTSEKQGGGGVLLLTSSNFKIHRSDCTRKAPLAFRDLVFKFSASVFLLMLFLR